MEQTKMVQFLRAAQIHKTSVGPGLLPVSKSLWHHWVKTGFAPAPIKIGRVSLWRVEDVAAFAESLAKGDAP